MFLTPGGQRSAAADPEGFAHSAAAEGSSAREEQQKAIWSYVSAYLSAGGDLELRFCIVERRRRFGVAFLHVLAPAVVWSYVSACRNAGGHMDLRFCMPERHGRGGRSKCGCGQSFVYIEGLRGGGSNHCSFMLGSSPSNILRRIATKHTETQCLKRRISDPR